MNKSLYEKLVDLIYSVLIPLANFLPRNKDGKYILCYHSISDDPWRFATPPVLFEKHLLMLKKHYELVTLDEILNAEKPTSKPQVAITFDDGYLDNLTQATTILAKHQVPATVFAISHPHQADREQLSNHLELMNYSHMRNLLQKGISFGSHTMHHVDLLAVSDKHSIEQISQSKQTLEEELNISIKYFAYPRGHFHVDMFPLLNKSGYQAAFTVEGGGVNLENRFRISRIPLEGKISEQHLFVQLSIPGLWLDEALLKLLHLKHHLITKLLNR